MFAECIIFLATFGSPNMPVNDTTVINQYLSCQTSVPKSMQKYAGLYYEHFDVDNIDTAIRIGWCESRGKATAHRTDNKDTGVMQFVPWTWNWVAEEYDLPKWDEWVILRWGRPYDFKGKTYPHNIGFEQTKVQYTPYYNILFASILAEDIYGRTQWRDWSSSQWCWEDSASWERKWKNER